MKLPELSLRELFLLVIIAAMGWGWWAREGQLKRQSEAAVTAAVNHQARITQFALYELISQGYLVDCEGQSVSLRMPKDLQPRTTWTYSRLHLDKPWSSAILRQFERDEYERDVIFTRSP